MNENSPWIVNATSESFQLDVIDRSNDVLVVVDFWAPWCGPCRQLAPIIEKLAVEYDGRFLLVKIDIEQEEKIAQAMGIQSIPLVVAFKDGGVVHNFQGVLPEEQIREWLNSLLPSPAQELVMAAVALEQSDPKAAEAKYREAAKLEPSDSSIQIALARITVEQGRDEECRAIIEALESRGFLEPEAEAIKSRLELSSAAEEAGDVEEARRAAEAAPDDLSKQIQLAEALVGSRRHEEALQICLAVVQQDKAGAGVDAKATMLRIFDALGASPLVSQYRRKLSTALY
ncbi:MAG: thioredoxin [Planctomycetaceae bacterium]|nr:thioredoxin [Planctomycetaceae bacterium]